PEARAPPAPPALRAPVAPAAAPRRDRRMLYLAGGVLGVLLVGAVVVFAAVALGFPEKYVLDDDEMPPGMSNARLSSSELRDAGMSRNPGPIDWDRSVFADGFAQTGADDPKEAHGQVLAAGAARIVILAMQYPNEDEARDAAQQMRTICSFGGRAGVQAVVLRDEDVVVVVMSGEGATRAQVSAVASALTEKVEDLSRVCST
ncbi:MAG TPA: hypothetical protein VFH78_10415, partial [Candidatus Thermoplasmatota archaeon]|nr:hypothetical protein [Candidatus Thermoplasmatota archaeon]